LQAIEKINSPIRAVFRFSLLLRRYLLFSFFFSIPNNRYRDRRRFIPLASRHRRIIEQSLSSACTAMENGKTPRSSQVFSAHSRALARTRAPDRIRKY